MSGFNDLLHLPGDEREQRWLQERLATLSVREGIALSAAVLRTMPLNAMDAINCLQSLDCYNVRLDTACHEELALDYLSRETRLPESALPFADLTRVGELYEEKHPGLFVGSCYVEYPQKKIQPAYAGQGTPLPEDNGWSVKLKIASDAVPEGVWLRLPGWYPSEDERSIDEELTLRELGVQKWSECTLLDARCVLPQAGDLMEQYDNVTDLIRDGANLGSILDVHSQEPPAFIPQYTAALEMEHCRTLRLALDVFENLICYDRVSRGDLAASAAELLLDAGVPEEFIHSCFDLAAYKAYLLKEQGYTRSADGSYIRRNDIEFRYVYSTPAQTQPGTGEMEGMK